MNKFSFLDPAIPVITSFSSRRYAKIDQLYSSLLNNPVEKISTKTDSNSLASIQELSAIYARQYSLFRLDQTNASFTGSDFNNNQGNQVTQEKTFKVGDYLNSTSHLDYNNYTATNFSSTPDPNYVGLASLIN